MSLATALDERFLSDEDGRSDLIDICNHGIDAGFGGFIYSTELCEFFNEHESDIEDVLDDMGITLNDIVRDPQSWTFQEVKERSVWIVVENYCHSMFDEVEAGQDD